MSMELETLHKLSSSALRGLAASLTDGEMSSGITTHAVQQIAGASMTGELVGCLSQLVVAGWSTKQIGLLVLSIADAHERGVRPENLFDLVLSGPEVPGIPTRDTATVMQALIEKAQEEVLLVGYAVHNAKRLFERLAQKMEEPSKLKVWFCLNIERRHTDTSLSNEIVRRFALDFTTKHWPWEPKPEIYYDPRALEDPGPTKFSLHAKCLIIDRKEALITSANFTEAAQKRNIEAGVIVRYAQFVERLASYLDALRQSLLKRCDFPGPISSD